MEASLLKTVAERHAYAQMRMDLAMERAVAAQTHAEKSLALKWAVAWSVLAGYPRGNYAMPNYRPR